VKDSPDRHAHQLQSCSVNELPELPSSEDFIEPAKQCEVIIGDLGQVERPENRIRHRAPHLLDQAGLQKPLRERREHHRVLARLLPLLRTHGADEEKVRDGPILPASLEVERAAQLPARRAHRR
jgi:hypothetical protein